jgi:hypothetical protein
MGLNWIPFCRPSARARRQPLRGGTPPRLEQLEARQLLSTSVLTYHNDLARSGANLSETTLTHANVNSATFGKLFSYSVDGYIYAQPLYVPNVTLPDGSVHNIVFVATEHDSVYAFDANNSDPTQGGGLLWQDSFIDPTSGITPVPAADTQTNDIVPEVGITGTPVIDASSGVLYVVTKTKEVRSDGDHYVQTLQALDIATGKEVYGGPGVVADTLYLGGDNYQLVSGVAVPGNGAGGANGVVAFNALREHQRSALALANGVVYVSWASHGDFDPYHGWVIGYDAHTLNPLAIFNDSSNGSRGGIWMAGGAPAVDASGNLYLAIGNGTFAVSGSESPGYGDSIVKLDPNLQVTDSFTPYEEDDLDMYDLDLGSGGVLLLPDSVGSAAHPQLMVQAGKEGKIYLLDRNDLGQFQRLGGATDDVVQVIPNAVQGYVMSTPAFFNGMIYIQGIEDDLQAYRIADGRIAPTPVFRTGQVFMDELGGTASISANGTTDGIVWTLDVRGVYTGSPAVLYAYNADGLSQELYDSTQAGSRDVLGNAVKFTVPTIADGEVFVGTQNTLEVLGLLSGGMAARPHPGPSNLAAVLLTTETVRPLEAAPVLEAAAPNTATASLGGEPLDQAGHRSGNIAMSHVDHLAASLPLVADYHWPANRFAPPVVAGRSFAAHSRWTTRATLDAADAPEHAGLPVRPRLLPL